VYCTPFYRLIAGIKGEEITMPKRDEILTSSTGGDAYGNWVGGKNRRD
jgi:hypothetical protein